MSFGIYNLKTKTQGDIALKVTFKAIRSLDTPEKGFPALIEELLKSRSITTALFIANQIKADESVIFEELIESGEISVMDFIVEIVNACSLALTHENIEEQAVSEKKK